MRFTTLLFDFDYTLADSSAGVIECVGHALDRLDLPPAADEAIRGTIGLSLPATLKRLTGCEDEALAAEFSRLFVERADQVMVDRTLLFPGVAAPLVDLERRGARLGIVSTKYRHRIRTILRRDGLLHLFPVIVGGEDVAVHKPDPGGLDAARRAFKAAPTDILYIGDSPTDAETARNAGVPFAALLTGVTPAAAFRPYRPRGIFTRLPALRDWLVTEEN